MAATRIGLIGQPFWTAHLARLLNQHAEGSVHAEVVPLGSLASWRGLARLRRLDVLLRVGFRPGAPTARGVAFDTLWEGIQALAPGGRVIYYWIGTDVVHARDDVTAGRIRRRAWGRALAARHLAGAPWFVDELADIGIQAVPCLFPSSLPWAESPSPLPARFGVMTYLPDSRHEYYGGEAVYQAAKALPHVRFEVVGGSGSWIPSPLANLRFHGWQQDIRPFYDAASVVARLVPHDALGGTVREALMMGRHVIYTYPIPFTNTVPFGDSAAMIRVVERLHDLHLAGSLPLNEKAVEYAKAEFDEQRTVAALIERLVED